MKIIISHDVDHLYPSDHIFRDLIFPKLWIRSLLDLLKGKICYQTLFNRLFSIFDERLNRIPEIVEFDKRKGIPSVFFFGMDSILGMSYKKETAAEWIKYVLGKGFDAGVHGVEFKNIIKMLKEYNDFKTISTLNSFGIRTHYVRYDDQTFAKMAELGYLFDTSEFDKRKIKFNMPYKIGEMWEFPLYIMDGYLIKDKLEIAIEQTIALLDIATKNGVEYFTFLFHDYLFNKNSYPLEKAYYEWFVDYCQNHNLTFISYRNAISELERKSHDIA